MKNVLAVLLTVLSFSSFAEIKDINKMPFGMVGEEQTATSYFHMDDGSTWKNTVSISVGKDGMQRVYFTRFYSTGSYCTLKGSKNGTEQQVWTVDGQNVRMNVYCSEYTDSKGEYYQTAYATSNAGERFISERFKKAQSEVSVKDTNGFLVNYSAKGFTKAWNTAGGNAL